MSSPARDPEELFAELRYALDEGYAELPPEHLLDRILNVAYESREPGRPVDRPAPISGADVFARSIASLNATLEDLTEADWKCRALRGLDVQGLLGHLIGVEETFIKVVSGDPSTDSDDHIGSTQPYALAQAGKTPTQSLREWQLVTARSVEVVSTEPPEREVAFYGVALPLAQLLVIRAFEMWVHEEDVRRATDRSLNPPDAEPLSRMAELAVALLPAGIARAGLSLGGQAVRLVLTGPAGGSWTVAMDGRSAPSGAESAIVVVDTAAFCRVVGNRLAQCDTGAWIDGDQQLAADLFTGAAELALD